MAHPEAYRCFEDGHIFGCISTHDGRAVCERCGYEEPHAADEYEHDEGGEERWCHTCGGEGWGISGDDWPVDDAVNDCPGEVERCPNCRGSGLAKDCWYW